MNKRNTLVPNEIAVLGIIITIIGVFVAIYVFAISAFSTCQNTSFDGFFNDFDLCKLPRWIKCIYVIFTVLALIFFMIHLHLNSMPVDKQNDSLIEWVGIFGFIFAMPALLVVGGTILFFSLYLCTTMSSGLML